VHLRAAHRCGDLGLHQVKVEAQVERRARSIVKDGGEAFDRGLRFHASVPRVMLAECVDGGL
jgi:hypothetical protein